MSKQARCLTPVKNQCGLNLLNHINPPYPLPAVPELSFTHFLRNNLLVTLFIFLAGLSKSKMYCGIRQEGVVKALA